MPYTPDPTDPTQPTIAQAAGNMAYELQAIKGYIQSLIVSGSGFAYSGSLRNRFKNGGLRVAQKGLGAFSVTAGTGQYTADQWLVFSSGGTSTVTLTAKLDIAGIGTLSPLNISFGAGVTSCGILCRIESIDTSDLIVGTPITISGWYLTNDVNVTPTVLVLTPTIGPDNYTSAVINAAPSPAVTFIPPFSANSWTHFSATVVLTVDCSTNGIAVGLLNSTTNTATVSYGKLQLEKGSLATPFEERPYSVDFAMCQRCYQVGTIIMGGSASLIGGNVQASVSLPVTMRLTPAVTTTSNANSNISSYTLTGTTQIVFTGGTATATGSYTVNVTFSADANL